MEEERALAIPQRSRPPTLNNNTQRSIEARASRPVPHWGIEEVRAIAQATRRFGRGWKGERDGLLVETMFDAALRVGEALSLTPSGIKRTPDGYMLEVMGKNGWRQAAASPSLVARLQAYAYERQLPRSAAFWPFNRHQAWMIVDRAVAAVGIAKPPRVGTVHILRHSGAIERLRVARNPKAVQDQLGHASPQMTMRYMKTLAHDESLAIMQGVDFGW